MEYVIYGSYRGNTEEIDSFSSMAEARAMLQEYRLAFGATWRLWIRRERILATEAC